MKSKSLKTVVVLCAGLVLVAATMVSARAGARLAVATTMIGARSSTFEARATLVSLERATSIVRWVLLRERAPGRPVRLARSQEASARLQEVAPAAPAADAAPSRPAARRSTPAPPARVVPPTEPQLAQEVVLDRPFGAGRPIVRVGQDYTVKAADVVNDVVIVGGSLRVEGHVTGDVVVVLGTVDLAGTAVIDGDLVDVGGGGTAAQGAVVRGDMVTIGGDMAASAAFSPGGNQVVVGSRAVGERIRALVPWITSGLMLGRPLVPSLAWNWVVVAIFLLVALVLSLVFEPGVRACAEVISAKPLTTFLSGLLVLLLLGPISFILAVSVIGIVVLPFLFCALLIGSILGQIAVARWIGWSVIRESEPDNRAQAVRSIVVGFALITLAYMVPILGMVTWILVGVLGLGGATSTLFKALRRENPAAPKPPAPVVPSRPLESPSGGAASAAHVVAASDMTTEAGPAPEAGPVMSDAPPPRPPGVTGFGLLALPRATFWQRVAAGLLDVLLVTIIFQIMDIDRRAGLWFLVLLTAYNAVFWTWRGTTIGGLICQLRVVRTDGQPLVFGDSVIRGLSSLFSLLVLGIGFFWIALDSNREKQAWHDIIAGTVVVREPRSSPLR